MLNSTNSYVNISLVNLVFCSLLSMDFSGRTQGHTVLWVPDVDILFVPFYTWKAVFLDIKFLFYVFFPSSIVVVNFSVDLPGPQCPYIAKHCSGWFTLSGLWVKQIVLHNMVCACSVLSDSLQPLGLWPIRLLRPWIFPGKNTGMGCHFLL